MNKTATEETVDVRALCKQVDELQSSVEFVLNGKKYYILDEEDHEYFLDLESAHADRAVAAAKADGGEMIPLEEVMKKHNVTPPADVQD